MDQGRTYLNAIAVNVALVILSLGLAVGLTLDGRRIDAQRSRLQIVSATITSFQGGAPKVTFKDEIGTDRTMTLNRRSGRTDRVGNRIELAYPPGQWLRAVDAPTSSRSYVGAAVMLLVGPLLVVHDLRLRRRLAIARAPGNLQAVNVEVRTTRAGRNMTRQALLSFAGSPRGLPDARVVLTPTFRRLPDGRYPGQIAGDLRFGGTVAVWIAGQAVRTGNLQRA